MLDAINEWFAGSSLNCVYGGAVAVGLIYSLLLIFFQGVDDLFSGLDSVLDIFNIDLDVGGAHPHGGDGSGISMIAISVFISAFGTFGLVSRGAFDANVPASVVAASFGGIVFGGLAQWFFVMILSPTTSSMVTQSSLVGQVAEVLIPIPKNGLGEIVMVSQGSRIRYSAKSYDNKPIARGTEVRIERIIGSTATVIPTSEYEL
jgi:membrane protein implicated in regulation of membrane protease activity